MRGSRERRSRGGEGVGEEREGEGRRGRRGEKREGGEERGKGLLCVCTAAVVRLKPVMEQAVEKEAERRPDTLDQNKTINLLTTFC